MTDKKPRTYVTIILDQSSSMEDTKAQTVVGYNEQVQQMRANAKDQDIKVSLLTFNGNVFEHLWCEDASKLVDATAQEYICFGATAYYDAWGYAIKKLKETTDINDPNNAYLVIIISDGDENSSKHYSPEDIRRETVKLQEQRWTFNFIGASKQNVSGVAAQTGIPISNCAVWSNTTPSGTRRGLHRSAGNMGNYLRCRGTGQAPTISYCSADTKAAADYTDPADAMVVDDQQVDMVVGSVAGHDVASQVFTSTTPVSIAR